MATFLFILAGLIVFNFVLLKFSIQSVDGDKRKSKNRKTKSTPTLTGKKPKATSIAKAA